MQNYVWKSFERYQAGSNIMYNYINDFNNRNLIEEINGLHY